VTSASDMLRIEGYNFSETITNAIVFIDIINKTPPEAIQDALDNANGKNDNFKVTWNSGNDTAIADLTFPTIVSEKFFNKPLKDIIEKYSVSDETNNGDFYWYVDNNNTLVWRPKGTAQDYTFNTTTEAHKALKIRKDVKGVKNFIILKGGSGPSGRQIQTRYVEWTSVAKHGMKYYFLVSEINSAKNLVGIDITRDYGPDNTDIAFPNITDSAYTTAWYSLYEYTTKEFNITATVGNQVIIDEGSENDNKLAYEEIIRAETINRLLSEGKQYADANKNGKLKVDITFSAGTKDWIIGSNILCTIPKVSDKDKKMRVVDIQFTNTTDTFTLEEDIGKI